MMKVKMIDNGDNSLELTMKEKIYNKGDGLVEDTGAIRSPITHWSSHYRVTPASSPMEATPDSSLNPGRIQVSSHPQGHTQASNHPQGHTQASSHPQGLTQGSSHPQGHTQGSLRGGTQGSSQVSAKKGRVSLGCLYLMTYLTPCT